MIAAVKARSLVGVVSKEEQQEEGQLVEQEEGQLVRQEEGQLVRQEERQLVQQEERQLLEELVVEETKRKVIPLEKRGSLFVDFIL